MASDKVDPNEFLRKHFIEVSPGDITVSVEGKDGKVATIFPAGTSAHDVACTSAASVVSFAGVPAEKKRELEKLMLKTIQEQEVEKTYVSAFELEVFGAKVRYERAPKKQTFRKYGSEQEM